MDEEWTHAEAEREQVSLRAQVTLLKQSQAAAQAEISKLRRELAQRSSSIVPHIFNFASRQRPESYYVGDAKDPDTERSAYSDQSSVSSDGHNDDSPRSCAADVPTADSIGASDWLAFDMVATLVAGPGVGRIGVGFLNLPPVPLVVKRVTRGSWAEKQGIRCGDEFMSVDHRRSRAFTSSEFVQAMKKRPLVIKLRRTVRKEGAEVPVLPQLASFGAEAPDAQSTDQEEEEEEEDEEEDEAEDMCPEKAQEVAEKLAKEVEANAKRDAERRSLSKKPGPLRGSEETAPPSGRHRLSAPLGVGEQLPKEMEKRLSLPSFQDDRLGDASWPKFRGVPRQEGETDPPDEEAAQQERSSKDSRSEHEEEGNMSCSTALIDSSTSIESTPTMDAAQSPSREMEQKETEDEFF